MAKQKTITLWLARDPDGTLCVHEHEPHRVEQDVAWETGFPWWFSDRKAGSHGHYLMKFCTSHFRRVVGFLPRNGTAERIRITIKRVDK